MNSCKNINLKVCDPAAYPEFTSELQRAFTVAVRRECPDFKGVVPDKESVMESCLAENSVVYDIVVDGVTAGGAVISVDGERGDLELLFVKPEFHGSGIGRRVWKLIEESYPDVRVWQTITPYFEKRNIHFYVNKCGFRIVEFFNEKHIDKNYEPPESEKDLPCLHDYFRFEKTIK